MSYQLHIPPKIDRERPSLVVMLHACGQTPDDLAVGTRMNELADQRGFAVVYPVQTAAANPLRCWNWFDHKNQFRGRGEPSLIADIARRVAAEQCIGAGRIFVAGLSAGGAMAVILGATYPELFAAVGVHSGLPYGAAHDPSSAVAAMRGESGGPLRVPSQGVPTIVFHGDADTTVNVRNGAAIIDQAVSLLGEDGAPSAMCTRTQRSAGGRSYTTMVYGSPDMPSLAEYWVLHGAGHAWSGGSPLGSCTDPAGPDASVEMIRFFLAHSRR